VEISFPQPLLLDDFNQEALSLQTAAKNRQIAPCSTELHIGGISFFKAVEIRRSGIHRKEYSQGA